MRFVPSLWARDILSGILCSARHRPPGRFSLSQLDFQPQRYLGECREKGLWRLTGVWLKVYDACTRFWESLSGQRAEIRRLYGVRDTVDLDLSILLVAVQSSSISCFLAGGHTFRVLLLDRSSQSIESVRAACSVTEERNMATSFPYSTQSRAEETKRPRVWTSLERSATMWPILRRYVESMRSISRRPLQPSREFIVVQRSIHIGQSVPVAR